MVIDRFACAAVMTACVGLLLAATPAAAEITLAPSSEWRFREFDDRCRASRTFGEGEERTRLWLEQGGEQANYNLTLIGQPFRNPYGRGIQVQFGEEPESIRSYISAESSKGNPVLRMYGVALVPPTLERDADSPASDITDDAARLDAITTLRLRSAIPEAVELALGPITEAASFLRICGAKLGVLLSEAGRPLSAEARPPVAINPDEWLREEDYPAYLVKARMGGKLTVRLTVSTKGTASSCFVIESNKPQIFDDATCLGLMRRARFEPARDANRQPVPSYYFQTVTFAIR